MCNEFTLKCREMNTNRAEITNRKSVETLSTYTSTYTKALNQFLAAIIAIVAWKFHTLT